MQLAKDALDVGLLTDDTAMLDFFREEVGLGEPELLPVVKGVDQHRFDFHGSIIKVNVVAALPVEARSGYAGIVLADEALGAPRRLVGPDGVEVVIARPGDGPVDRLGVRLRVPDRARAEAYFRDAIGWDVHDGNARVGTSSVLVEESGDAPGEVKMPVKGWTYLTVQIHDCDAETTRVVERGAVLAADVRNMGEVARISMVADPFGNQLEISQRASLTGVPVPQDEPAKRTESAN